jgi:hypothetical protein
MRLTDKMHLFQGQAVFCSSMYTYGNVGGTLVPHVVTMDGHLTLPHWHAVQL